MSMLASPLYALLQGVTSLEQVTETHRRLPVNLVVGGSTWISQPAHSLTAVTGDEGALDGPRGSTTRPGRDGSGQAGSTNSELHGPDDRRNEPSCKPGSVAPQGR